MGKVIQHYCDKCDKDVSDNPYNSTRMDIEIKCVPNGSCQIDHVEATDHNNKFTLCLDCFKDYSKKIEL